MSSSLIASQWAAPAVAAVRRACLLATAVANKSPERARVDAIAKDDASPVTVADFGVQALLALALSENPLSRPAGAPRGATTGGAGGDSALHAPLLRMVAEEDTGALREDAGLLARVVDEVNAALPRDGGGVWAAQDVLAAVASGGLDPAKEASDEPYWVLDPIDGTKGFVRREQYCIGLALVKDSQPVLGILGCPNLWSQGSDGGSVGKLFVAIKGEGTREASLEDGDAGEAVHVSSADGGGSAPWADTAGVVFCESRESAHSSRGISGAVAAALGCDATPPVRVDSMVKYGLVARGEAHLYLRFPRKGYVEKVWDHAAGCLVLSEAGGIVTDLWDKPLDFSTGRQLSRNTGVVASAHRALHDKALGAAQAAFRAERGDAAAGGDAPDDGGLVAPPAKI